MYISAALCDDLFHVADIPEIFLVGWLNFGYLKSALKCNRLETQNVWRIKSR